MFKLSVITTVYNGEQFIKESLDSVFSQTFTDFEIIIVNDGSTDKTKEISLQYQKYSNVVYLENQYNEGVPYSRNKALIHAKGEYIAIHDADDVSLPHRFEQEVKKLDQNKNLTVIGSYAFKIGLNGQFLGSMIYPPLNTEKAFFVILQYKLNPIIDPSCMFRKQPIINIGGYRLDPDIRTAQDFDLWCRLLINGYQFANIPEPLIKYRINPNGVTRLKKEEQNKATDIVWSAFKRRNFPKVQLRQKFYLEKESVLDILKENN